MASDGKADQEKTGNDSVVEQGNSRKNRLLPTLKASSDSNTADSKAGRSSSLKVMSFFKDVHDSLSRKALPQRLISSSADSIPSKSDPDPSALKNTSSVESKNSIMENVYSPNFSSIRKNFESKKSLPTHSSAPPYIPSQSISTLRRSDSELLKTLKLLDTALNESLDSNHVRARHEVSLLLKVSKERSLSSSLFKARTSDSPKYYAFPSPDACDVRKSVDRIIECLQSAKSLDIISFRDSLVNFINGGLQEFNSRSSMHLKPKKTLISRTVVPKRKSSGIDVLEDTIPKQYSAQAMRVSFSSQQDDDSSISGHQPINPEVTKEELFSSGLESIKLSAKKKWADMLSKADNKNASVQKTNQNSSSLLEDDDGDDYAFEDDDDESNIIYSDHPKYSRIKAATLDKLIEKMTAGTFQDLNSLNLRYVFLLTYRSFTTAEKILFRLASRYNVSPPLNLTPTECEIFEAHNVRNIRLKVLGLIKYWIKEFYPDFEERPILKSYLEEMLRTTFSDRDIYAKVSQSLLMLIKAQESKLLKEKTLERKEAQKLFKKFYSMDDILELEKNILEYDPVKIAEQLTWKDFECLKKIPVREFLGGSWTKSNKNDTAPNIVEMIERYNKVTCWTQMLILSHEDESKRAFALKRCLKIAYHLRELQNFSSLAGVYYGLTSNAVHRLKCMKNLAKKEQAIFDDLKDLFSNRQKGLRTVMELATNPLVPHLGLFLGDLTFLEQGNEDEMKDLINFRKQSMIAERIRWIKDAQQSGYSPRISQHVMFQQYMESHMKIIGEEELWTVSITREPFVNNN